MTSSHDSLKARLVEAERECDETKDQKEPS